MIASATSRDLLKWKEDWKDQENNVLMEIPRAYWRSTSVALCCFFTWVLCFVYTMKGNPSSQYCVCGYFFNAGQPSPLLFPSQCLIQVCIYGSISNDWNTFTKAKCHIRVSWYLNGQQSQGLRFISISSPWLGEFCLGIWTEPSLLHMKVVPALLPTLWL